MRVLGKTGLFGADRRGLGRALAVRGVRGGLPDGVLNLQTEAGLSLTGDADVLITGHSIISGKPVRIKLTDYGFEYYGDRAELARVREKRCVYHGRAVSPTKEN